MNAVVKPPAPVLPEPVARRGINEAQWRTLANNLYPGAKSDSVLMVWDYCVARKLDPMKKPCHIVPMKVGDEWRDVVMPGIYEYRTTATRTGLYLGHSKPEYGPTINYLNVEAPEYCDITVYRWNIEAKLKAEYPVRVKFREIAATARDKKTGDPYVNARWTKAPEQMLTKCTEAAALREAFPDELGGTHTQDELEGKEIDITPKGDGSGRPDTSNITAEEIEEHVCAIRSIMDNEEDKYADEYKQAEALRDYDQTYLSPFPELYTAVFDALAKQKIITKAKFREWLKLLPPRE